jgi:predicted RNA-binding protein associated with RNAse of E/G family
MSGTYVDLELDPHRAHDGRVWIDDEDQFAEACRAGLISLEVALQARAATTEITTLLRGSHEPFGVAGRDRLQAAIQMQLPPLTDLA